MTTTANRTQQFDADIKPVNPSVLEPYESVIVLTDDTIIAGVHVGRSGPQQNTMRIMRDGNREDIVEITTVGYGSDPSLIVSRSSRKYPCQQVTTAALIERHHVDLADDLIPRSRR